jgi:formate hydrogenlyase subunit 3/multisubunit Na+/H+ antiporter MnhD subunit
MVALLPLVLVGSLVLFLVMASVVFGLFSTEAADDETEVRRLGFLFDLLIVAGLSLLFGL